MSFQTIAIAIIFVAAVFYVGRLIFKSFSAKKGCGSNCKCGVDFSDIDSSKLRS